MFFRVLFILGCFFACNLCHQAKGNNFAIALTGENAPGTSGGSYELIDAGTLNENGEVAFTASLDVGVGGVTSFNSEGVWKFSSGSSSLVARTGVGNVPGVVSSDYLTFYTAAIDDSGEIVLRADLSSVPISQASGLWRYSDGSGTLIARTGSGDVPGLNPSVNFFLISNVPSVAANGDLSFVGQLEVDVVNVFNGSDRGIWKYSANTGALVAREGTDGVPGFSSSIDFLGFARPEINNADQVAFFAVVNDLQSDQGAWLYTGASGQLITQSDIVNVPDVANAIFIDIDDPTQNDSGQNVFKADISLAGSNSFGVWSYTGSSGSLLLHETIGGVPGNSSADIQSLQDPWINNAGQVLIGGELVVGQGGVTNANSQGLWFLDAGGSEIARSGSGGVPELPIASFDTFDRYALNNAGQIALLASLESGIGGVDSTNDQGLWIINPLGDSALIAREGDLLAGNTIASLDFIADRRSIDGFNDSGQLLFQATFTNNETGLFLYRPLAADFNSDGNVDGEDLASWQSSYGQSAGGDANLDGITDNLDFLYWAREFSSGITVANLLTAVPEPTSTMLILTGMWFLGFARRRIRP